MQPDFGTASATPGGQFSFPRSYVKFVTCNFADGTVVYVPGLMTLFYPGADPVTEYIVFRDYFAPWSSNCYTLDGIVASITYFFSSDPGTPHPGGINVAYEIHGDPPTPHIVITPDLHGGILYPFALAAEPDDYWLHIPA